MPAPSLSRSLTPVPSPSPACALPARSGRRRPDQRAQRRQEDGVGHPLRRRCVAACPPPGFLLLPLLAGGGGPVSVMWHVAALVLGSPALEPHLPKPAAALAPPHVFVQASTTPPRRPAGGLVATHKHTPRLHYHRPCTRRAVAPTHARRPLQPAAGRRTPCIRACPAPLL